MKLDSNLKQMAEGMDTDFFGVADLELAHILDQWCQGTKTVK